MLTVIKGWVCSEQIEMFHVLLSKIEILASDGLIYGELGLCLSYLNMGFTFIYQEGVFALLSLL